MSKRDNLSDYLSDLYQGIKSKKPDASRNPQDFRGEIEQIETKSPEWDGSYETSPDMDFTDSPVIREATVPITENNRTYTAGELVSGADGISRFTVAVEGGGSSETVPEWNTETDVMFVKRFNDKLTQFVPAPGTSWDGSTVVGKNDNKVRFTVALNDVPDIGSVMVFCSHISQGDGGELQYGIVRTAPDVSGILGIEFPKHFTVYDGESWYTDALGEGIRRIEFRVSELFGFNVEAAAWFDENTTPGGVEPTAEVSYGSDRMLLYDGDVIQAYTKDKKLTDDLLVKANSANATIPEGFIKPSGNLEIIENGDDIDVAEFATVSVKVPSTCDRPLGYWFFYNGLDQFEDIEWDDEGNETTSYRGIKDSVTVPPQVQDGSATTFENLFASYYVEFWNGAAMDVGVWAKEINGVINCESVTALNGLFEGCWFTEKICPIINTENVTDFSFMFYNCMALLSTPTIDMRSAQDARHMFTYCHSLESVNLKNINTSIDISSAYNLTVDSLVGLCYELISYSGSSSSEPTLTIGETNLAKLADVYVKLVDITDEMREEDEFVSSKKPFVRCESTDEGAVLITDYVVGKNWKLQ